VRPDIPGVNRENVVMAQDALRGLVKVKPNAVIIGGGLVGCETGHYLSGRGIRVTMVEMLPRMASDMPPMARRRLLDGLRKNRVVMINGATCREISETGVTVATADGKEETVPAETVVLAVGYRADDHLVQALRGKAVEVFHVGDARQPQRIREAVNDGYKAGLSI